MKVDDLRIGQTVQWHSDLVSERLGGGIPPARIITIKEKLSHSPDLRVVDVLIWFDRPLFRDSIVDKTYRVYVHPKHLTLIEQAEPWTGREGEVDD